MSETLSLREAAAFIGIGRGSFSRLIAEGHIRPVPIPGYAWRRFRKSDLEQFLGTNGGTTTPIHSEQVIETAGQFQRPRETRISREAQLDEVFKRK